MGSMGEARLTVSDEAECRHLHEATQQLLAEAGVKVRYEPASELLRAVSETKRGRPDA